MVGNQQRINEVIRFMSNMQSGMFLPLQMAAATALGLGQDWHDQLNAMYRERQQKAFELLRMLHCGFDEQQAGLFVWASVPQTVQDGFAPVSYTHLDVYKRQILVSSNLSLFLVATGFILFMQIWSCLLYTSRCV